MSNFQDYSFIDPHPVLCYNKKMSFVKVSATYVLKISGRKGLIDVLPLHILHATSYIIDIANHLAYLSVPHRWIFIGDNYLFQGSSFAGVVFCPNLKMNTTFSLS